MHQLAIREVLPTYIARSLRIVPCRLISLFACPITVFDIDSSHVLASARSRRIVGVCLEYILVAQKEEARDAVCSECHHYLDPN